MKLGKGERPTRYPVSEERLEKSRIPRKVWGATIEKIEKDALREKVAAYVVNLDELIKRGGMGVCLIGESGTGKTSITSILAKEYISRGHLVYYSTIPDLREALREKMNYDEETTIAARMRMSEVVILDGLENLEDHDHYVNTKYVVELIKSRRDEYGRNGPKVHIFTSTALPTTDLAKAIESCCDTWAVKGEDKRARKLDELKGLLQTGKKKK